MKRNFWVHVLSEICNVSSIIVARIRLKPPGEEFASRPPFLPGFTNIFVLGFGIELLVSVSLALQSAPTCQRSAVAFARDCDIARIMATH